MTINEYQRQALRTEAPEGVYMDSGDVLRAFLLSRGQITPDEITSIMRLLEGLMGVNGEAGEAVDILKKVLFQGHKLNREHIALELGDICWYLALAADAIGYPLEEIMAMNLEKLRRRYPDGFAVNRSIKRKAGDI